MKNRWLVTLALMAVIVLGVTLARAEWRRSGPSDDLRACSETAETLFTACGFQTQDDFYVARAVCLNTSDDAERLQCEQDAESARDEATALCQGQKDTRLAACASLGEGRYDPDIEPVLFETKYTRLANPNRYFPLTIGNRWKYSGGTETDTVEVTSETKLIDGVTCIVLRDLVYDRGVLKEATDDWYAQAKDGDVWYFGEEAKDYEVFKGDSPPRPELVSIDGSFKAGREGDKAGVIFRASPRAGETYVEEASLGNAEDVTDVVSTTYAYGRDPELDRYVPRRLAELFCSAGDCVVTRNYSLLEPGIFDRKFYARGIGVFLEIGLNTGAVDSLVGCNFDPRCARLPIR